MALDLTQERIALNQITFREANEKIEAAADRMELVGEIPFICECPDIACTQIVRLDNDAYEAVRQNPRRFFTTPGHENISVEAGAAVVVENRDGETILDKIGTAGEIAERDHEENWA